MPSCAEVSLAMPGGYVTDDHYTVHRWVEAISKPPGDTSPRRYVWRLDMDGRIRLRAAQPFIHGLCWEDVPIPADGTRISFTLAADARKRVTIFQDQQPIKRVRRPLQGRSANICWITRQAEAAGLLLEEADYEEAFVTINMPDRSMPRYQIATFIAHARVADSARLAHSMVFGIGNAKAFGLGFLTIETRD